MKSVALMNNSRHSEYCSPLTSFDWNEVDQIVTVQPGVITEELHQYVEEKGYFFPIDLAAKGSSQIGGNVATNAGGLRVLRYGMMRNWVSGLKVVTGKGESLYLGKKRCKQCRSPCQSRCK